MQVNPSFSLPPWPPLFVENHFSLAADHTQNRDEGFLPALKETFPFLQQQETTASVDRNPHTSATVSAPTPDSVLRDLPW